MTDLAGQTFGRYYITERLGEGGMAVVYKAHDERLERDVAIKIIRSGSFPTDAFGEALKRFEREAKSLAKLSHPSIVKVYDYGEQDGSPYIVMEYMAGGTLRKLLGKPILWQTALRLLLPVARGVDYAHQRGIVHRDIKPANILITDSGDPMLSDFGIAKLFEADQSTHLTGTGMLIGTPEYMAPEQWDGKTTTQSDLYALGIVLYEMVTGQKPYMADTPVSLMLKQATEPLPSPQQFVADLPEAVESLLLKSLARDPRERFATMRALIQAMEASLAAVPTVQSVQPDPSTQTQPQTSSEAGLRSGMPGSSLSKSDSVSATKGQTNAASPVTQTRRASAVGLFAIFGGVGFFAILGMVVIVLLALPGLLRKPATPVPTATLPQSLPLVQVTATSTQAPKTELGFTIVEPQAALKMAPELKNLSQLSGENYSVENWNKINALLTFTVDSQAAVPIIWNWGWCATTDEILKQNMTKIEVVFNADGYVIPKDRLASDTYDSNDPAYKDWKCTEYLTVLRNWKPGTYKLKETIRFSSTINDGKVTFEAGSMYREYTVNIAP